MILCLGNLEIYSQVSFVAQDKVFTPASSIVCSVMQGNLDPQMPNTSRSKTFNLVRIDYYSRQKMRTEEPTSYAILV